MKKRIFFSAILLLSLFREVAAQGDGYIQKNGQRLFPIGSYYLPKEDVELKRMIDAGFNLFACRSKSDLDRLHKYGVQGWVFLPMAEGVTPALKERIDAVAGHPALALWSGPDELVWGFTANSRLYREEKIHKALGAWRNLSPEAVQYARQKSALVMPALHKAIDYLRSKDTSNLQLWINEGENSDMAYVGQYMDAVDITGFDLYPIKTDLANGDTKPRKSIQTMGKSTRRWTIASEGKPVWIVLQAFSWVELKHIEPHNANGRPLAYPSFYESRYMAYDVIANGARGVLYWDMLYLTSDQFKTSLLGIASELNALLPFLSTDPKPITITAYQPEKDNNNQVVGTARQYGRDWMVTLVNESDTAQHAVMVEGLGHLNGHQLVELYGEEEVEIRNGKFITRLRPFEVKVFATGRKWEANNQKGRDYSGK